MWCSPSLAPAATSLRFLSFHDPLWKTKTFQPSFTAHSHWQVSSYKTDRLKGISRKWMWSASAQSVVRAIPQLESHWFDSASPLPWSLMPFLQRFHGPRGATADLNSTSSPATFHLFFNSCWQSQSLETAHSYMRPHIHSNAYLYLTLVLCIASFWIIHKITELRSYPCRRVLAYPATN